MNKRYLALMLVVVGFVIYFLPQVQAIASDSQKLTGALFAVGGVILWYLPGKHSGSTTSKKASKK